MCDDDFVNEQLRWLLFWTMSCANESQLETSQLAIDCAIGIVKKQQQQQQQQRRIADNLGVLKSASLIISL